MKPYSIDFRQKVIDVYESEKLSQRELARRFQVALSFVHKLIKQYRATHSVAPKLRTQQTPSKLGSEHLAVLQRIVEEHNDATLVELGDHLLRETGIKVSRSTIDRTLKKLNLTFKKRPSMQRRKPLNEFRRSV